MTPPPEEKKPAGPKKWTPEEKLRVLVAAQELEGEELGALLRREGLHEAQLNEWRQVTVGALGEQPGPVTTSAWSEPRQWKEELVVSGTKFDHRRSQEKGAATMTTLTVRTNPVKRSYRNSLWPQLDAASCAIVGFSSKSLVGFDRIGAHPPVPC
ncbi:transposase [Myxococcus sp. K15C18031901]|nr:transposase [Myxococcus dinghuensis]